MKDLLKQLAAYNIWANQRLFELINGLQEEKQLAQVPSSFKSLLATTLHMWDAESIWWQRMKLHERFTRPSDNFKGNFKDVVNGLMSQSKLWEGFVNNSGEHVLDHVLEYRDSKKEQVKMPVYHVLLQVFNHGSYHRGQLVNMLRQLGIDKIPMTDFSIFARQKK
jgi:uncharacterized damage-inducible protein DinB